jgi:transketolase
VDGHDPDSIADAIRQAVSVTDKPSLLCCRTTIGFGAPSKAGTAGSHGSPLGEDEVSGARRELDWPHAPFVIPDDIAEGWDCRTRGADLENSWKQSFAEYEQAFPAQAAELQRRMTGKLPADWSSTMDLHLAEVNGKAETIASRNASGNTIAAIAACLPEIIGGSADLSGSNCTRWPEAKSVSAEAADGNYVLYGVREFGMTAIANGLALHGGLLPFTGTFLTFMEYARNAVRMSALMSIRNIMVYTHDSIGLGEDGPTHQPIEQLCNLRTTPNMSVWRPCDAVETVQAWRHAIEHQGPTALILSRQSLQHQVRDDVQLADMGRGGYILKEPDQPPALIIISTGSEVEIAMQAAVKLDAMSIPTRVVSMPSVDVFEQQTSAYKESVLPKALRKRIAIEAAQPDYWYKYVGFDGAVMGIDRFGASAPIDEVYTDLGLTVERLIETARSL